MTNLNRLSNLEFGGPATYRIVVNGIIDERWLERLGGMAISEVRGDSEASRTTLTGPLQDQAALRGVLESLYSLHLSIQEVVQIEDPSENDSTGN